MLVKMRIKNRRNQWKHRKDGGATAVTAGCWQMLEHTPTSFIPREDQGIVRILSLIHI